MRTDVAIVGAGPSGTCAALNLRRRGIDAVLIEKKPFPRYHVGESMTGEAAAILRGLGLEEQMDQAGHAVKHAVSVIGGATRWWIPLMGRAQSGELFSQNAWQVRRSKFDAMMLEEATGAGAGLLRGRALRPLVDEAGVVRGVRVAPDDGPEIDVEAEMVLDCSGQATFLAAQGITGPKYMGTYDKQLSIFSQVAGFQRDDGSDGPATQPGNTLIFFKEKYHWAWTIPLDDEVVSVGVVCPSQHFVSRRESKEEFLRRELQELHPDLADRLPQIEFVEPMHAVPNYSFQVRRFAGPGFICVGDSHRFVDPVISFGIFFALTEAEMATEMCGRWLNGEGRGDEDFFFDYMVRCEQAIDGAEDLIDCFWEHPLAFSVFATQRYRDSMIDALAGRLEIEEAQPALSAVRKVLGRTRSYDREGLFSIPFGSRFHGEAALRWGETARPVETTETWMNERDANSQN